LLLLAGPAALVWHTLHPPPWNPELIRARFQTVRYERAGLVFTYRVENHTRRPAHLARERTTIRVKQAAGQPAAGYPAIHLPLEIEPQSSRDLEIRLELPLPRPEADAEQTARVLQHHLPGTNDWESPLAPLPMARPQDSPAPGAAQQEVESLVEQALSAVEGFELVSEASGIRLMLPRGW